MKVNNVSIVTPVYNGSEHVLSFYKHIRKISESLKIIFVDDASSDNTLEIIEHICESDAGVHLVRMLDNKGPAMCRFIGAKKANTKYISLIDIDDKPEPKKFCHQTQFMERTEAVWSYHGRVHSDGKVVDQEIKSDYELYTQRYIGLSSVMIRYDVVEALKPTNDFRHGEDYMCWFRLNAEYGLPVFVPGLSYSYYINPKGLSANKIKQAYYVFLIYTSKSRSKVSFSKGLLYFLLYVKNKVLS